MKDVVSELEVILYHLEVYQSKIVEPLTNDCKTVTVNITKLIKLFNFSLLYFLGYS